KSPNLLSRLTKDIYSPVFVKFVTYRNNSCILMPINEFDISLLRAFGRKGPLDINIRRFLFISARNLEEMEEQGPNSIL
ncbi:MAG: hypothetical protein ACK2UM_02125, partial [Anaerolineales bacterium]